jgi:hypothetical protein
MADTAIVGRNIEVLQTNTVMGGMSAFSWGAAAGGAIAATAMSFILISLGSGIGLLAASPYSSGPSLTTLTIAGAVWIVLSQTWGHAVGGYLAGRLRTFASADPPDEADFRDGAHGFVAWAMGVLLTLVMVATVGMFSVGLSGHVASTLGAGATVAAGQQTRGGDQTAYYTDALFRTAPRQQTGSPASGGGAQTTSPSGPTAMPTPQGETPPTMQAQQPTAPAADAQARSEVGRIMATGMASGQLSDDDRAYLGRVVGARTGLPPEEANRRVQEVETRARIAAKEAGDKAAKAASMLSFWTFMSLLMGAAAAVIGGVVGGNHRDENLGLSRLR